MGSLEDTQSAISQVAGGLSQKFTQLSRETEASVSLFTDIATTQVPQRIKTIRTSGYSQLGVGASVYGRTTIPGVTPFRSQSQDGSWWQLIHEEPDAFMVGAIANASTPQATDQSAALNALTSAGVNRHTLLIGDNYDLSTTTGGFRIGAESIQLPYDRTVLGSGWATKLFVSPTPAVTKLFLLNSDGNGGWLREFPGHLNSKVGEFYISGAAATQTPLIAFEFAGSYKFHNINAGGLHTVISQANLYSDLVTVERVQVFDQPDNTQWAIDLKWSGDGVDVNQVHSYRKTQENVADMRAVRALHLRYKVGATVRNGINGDMLIEGSDGVDISSLHQEDGVTTIQESGATLRNANYWMRGDAYGLSATPLSAAYGLNSSPYPSVIHWSDIGFMYHQSFPGGYTTTKTNFQIQNSPSLYTGFIRIDRLFRKMKPEGGLASTGTKYGVTCGVPNFDNYSHWASVASEYRNTRWEINADASDLPLTDAILSTTGSLLAPDAVFMGSSGTYFYSAQLLYDKVRQIGISGTAEVSLTAANGGNSPVLVLTQAARITAMIRLYRGFSSGQYTHYVEVPLIAGARLADAGNDVGGYPWLNRPAGAMDAINVGSPASFKLRPGGTINTTSSAAYGRCEVLCRPNAVMPTTGNWRAGDVFGLLVPISDGFTNLHGWIRKTNGAAHVLGTDWIQDFRGVRTSLIQTDGTGKVSIIASPGVDCLAAVNMALSILKTAGGGTLVMPAIGGVGYHISDRILVDFSNCRIELCDNLKLTKNTVRQSMGVSNSVRRVDGTFFTSPNKPDQYDGVIIFRGTPATYLTGCSLVAPSRVTIDGNGTAIQAEGSYVHDAFANGNYSAVQFTMTISPVIRNIATTNSLSFGIHMNYCPGGIIENCRGANTVHENGIQVSFNAEHIRTFSETDQNTWGAYRVVNCESENCKNHGIGSYGAVGVQIVNPKVSNCGNDNGIEQAGPAGGINVEHDGTNLSRNYRVMITNPQVTSSFGFGIRTNALGTQVSQGNVVNTKKPTVAAYTAVDNLPYLWGSAVFVQGGASMETFGLQIDGADRVGYRANSAGTLYPSLKVNGGSVTGCKERAVYAVSFSSVVISPETSIVGNGNSSDPNTQQIFTCEFNNAAGNVDQGVLDFSGYYYGNQGCVMQTSRVGTVILHDVTGGENNANPNAVPYHSCYIDTCAVMTKVEKVSLSGINLRQARLVRIVGSHARIVPNIAGVTGHQTNTGFPKIDYSTATITNSVTGPSLYGFMTALGALSVPAATTTPGALTQTVATPGALIGDIVDVSYNRPLQGCLLSAEVTAADVVTVRWTNFTGSVVNYATGGQLTLRTTRVLGN